MQEEVNQKTVALSIRTTKLTGKVLAAALGKVVRAVQKHHRKALTPQGRQSVKKLMDLTEYEFYLDLRKYGTVPHGGFGIGIERMVTFAAGTKHIREAIPFPRMLHRIKP